MSPPRPRQELRPVDDPAGGRFAEAHAKLVEFADSVAGTAAYFTRPTWGGSKETPMGLHPTKNDLSPKARESCAALLNDRLADCIDLQTQTKQAHWNVKGPEFIALHKLFDEINEDVEAYVDTIAERAVQLGGTVEGTARAVGARSTLLEYPLTITSGGDHVAALAIALAAFGKRARRAIEESQEHGDAATADVFTEVVRGIDKWLWMVEAHLQPSS